MFFYEVEGHMQKLSSFGRGNKIRPKQSLTLFYAGAPLIVIKVSYDTNIHLL